MKIDFLVNWHGISLCPGALSRVVRTVTEAKNSWLIGLSALAMALTYIFLVEDLVQVEYDSVYLFYVSHYYI